MRYWRKFLLIPLAKIVTVNKIKAFNNLNFFIFFLDKDIYRIKIKNSMSIPENIELEVKLEGNNLLLFDEFHESKISCLIYILENS